MKHFKFFIVFVTFSLLTVSPDAISTRIPSDYYCYKSKSCERGTTTVLGTWQWDIDTDQLVSSRAADLWWSHTAQNEREIVPVNGAYIKRIAQGGCYKYGPNEIMEKVNNFTPYIVEENTDTTLRRKRTIYNGKPVYELNTLINGGFLKQPVKEMNPLSVFKEGTVFAVITNQGKLVRLCVGGFHSSYDFRFREAYLLDPGWKKMVKQREEKRHYHILLDWTVFR
ncbi:MAG: hypothetical protein DRQ44_08405, partial [Gammaproteobacteria bacterium]